MSTAPDPKRAAWSCQLLLFVLALCAPMLSGCAAAPPTPGGTAQCPSEAPAAAGTATTTPSETPGIATEASATGAGSEGFDQARAQRLGADSYGMRPYVLALLRKGPNRSQDEATAEALQRAHLDNIGRLAEQGKLVVAGPFTDDGELRGVYIFAVPTVEEAQKLTETDPAIKTGRLVMELHPWYGSAALMEVNATHKRIAKDNH